MTAYGPSSMTCWSRGDNAPGCYANMEPSDEMPRRRHAHTAMEHDVTASTKDCSDSATMVGIAPAFLCYVL
jgi:hypothetical protein